MAHRLVKGTEIIILQSALDLLQLVEDPFRLQAGLLLPPPLPFLLFSSSSSSSLFARFVVVCGGAGTAGVTEDPSAIAGVAAAFAGVERIHASFTAMVYNKT